MNTHKFIVALSTLAVLVTLTLLHASTIVSVSAATVTSRMPEPTALLQFVSQGHVLGLHSNGFFLSNATYALQVNFVRANNVTPISETSAQTKNGAAPPLTHVEYPNLWDGITLTYRAPSSGIVESVYRLAPNADANAIRLRYNAPVAVNADGTLSIQYPTGALNESAPVAWQEIDGQRVAIAVSFVQRGERQVGFAVGAHDPQAALLIDPVLTWNTYLGSSVLDNGNGIAVDGSGNVYVTGYSGGTWGTPVRAFSGFYNAFAAKLDSSGALVWNTFLGSQNDDGWGIAVDGSGNVYVTGSSSGTWATPVRAYTSGVDSFAAKLDSSGALIWNTFLGGDNNDYGYGIAVRGSGNVYITGYSYGAWGTPVRPYTSGVDAYAAKLDSSGALIWNTFFDGADFYGSNGIAVDASENVYVAGTSRKTWGTPVRTFSGVRDAFAAKLDSSGALTWNTFLGGTGKDWGYGIAMDASGNVYVTGFSEAAWGTPIRAFSGVSDAYAVKLNSSGALIWNTFLGGSNSDNGSAIAVDGNENVYVSGTSSSSWGKSIRPSLGDDIFAAKLKPSGVLTWNTFLGGIADDFGTGIAVDANKNVYVAGWGISSWGTPVRPNSGDYDALVVKLPATPRCDQKPESALLISPADSTQVKGPKVSLDWGDTACATTYTVTVKHGSTKGTVVFKQGGLKKSNAVTTPLVSGETYYWHVVAKNSEGTTKSLWSKFTVK